TPEDVKTALASTAANDTPLVIIYADKDTGDTSAAYGFKTRAGASGILQVTGLTEDQSGVTIRYKLLKGGVEGPGSDDLFARLEAAKTISSNPGRDNALALLAKDAAKSGQVAV